MPLVTRCPLWLYLGSLSLPDRSVAVATFVVLDSLVPCSVTVSGEGVGFRLKRPIVACLLVRSSQGRAGLRGSEEKSGREMRTDHPIVDNTVNRGGRPRPSIDRTGFSVHKGDVVTEGSGGTSACGHLGRILPPTPNKHKILHKHWEVGTRASESKPT